jgi:ABC-2 type transport system ATP-binding protein
VTLWPNLSGGQAIDLLARLRGGLDEQRRGELLERFELDPTKKGRAYSKGNRQKVALVAALASDVELLILDEPTNGLDPAGIHEMRDLIRRLPDEFGVTVFLSSHLLGEVEQIATHIGIIHEGHLLFQGTLSELQSKQQTQLTVGVKQVTEATQFLENTGWSVQRCVDDLLKVSTKAPDDAVRINKLLVDRGMDVFHLAVSQRSLEDIFLSLTNGAGRAM